jgi:hypothetical protein
VRFPAAALAGVLPTAGRPPERVCLLRPGEPVTRQVFTVSRRGGDRKPAVRVVLDALAATPHTEFLLTG